MNDLTPKQTAALNLIKEGKEYEEYFFSKAKGLVWFVPLKNRGYFSPDNNPKTVFDKEGNFYFPHWPVLDYLERVSVECTSPENRTVAEELVGIIRDVTDAEIEENSNNASTWWYFLKIFSNLPTEVISIEDIDLVKLWIDHGMGETVLFGKEIGSLLLPKLLGSKATEDSLKALKVLEIVTEITRKESQFIGEEKPVVAIGAHWLSELFQKNAELIAITCAKEAVLLLQGRFIQATENNHDDEYSYMWRPAIEDHSQNSRRDEVEDVLVSAIRDILHYSTKCEINIRVILQDILQGSYITPKRIALYIIGDSYPTYAGLFWEALSSDLFVSKYQHEIYELLKRNFGIFSSEERTLILALIKGLKRHEVPDEKSRLYDAATKVNWLHAIKDQDDHEVDVLYRECIKLIGQEPVHPDFPAYMEVTSGSENPIKTERLLGMRAEEIVSFLKGFKEEKGWSTPTEEGLGRVLQEAASQSPENFSGELDRFLHVKIGYQYYLLSGFKDAWRDHKFIEWSSILEYCWAMVNDEDFWNQEVEEADLPNPTREWISSAISDLIAAGVRTDEWAMPEKQLSTAEKILIKILEMDDPTADPDDSDAFTEAINTSKGRCVEAFLDFTLHCARLEDSKDGGHAKTWERVRQVYENELEKCKNDNLEFSALVGAYVPNLLFLDKDWTLNHIDYIFSQEFPSNWYYAMSGYAYVVTSYKEIYCRLRERGDYYRALSMDLKNKQMRERLTQHVCLAYLSQDEVIGDSGSPFFFLLQQWQIEDIRAITSFFWSQSRDRIDEISIAQIMGYWNWCHTRISGHEEDNILILSDLVLLTKFLSAITSDQETWLKQAAPYVNANHNMHIFLEYLDELCERNSKQVAEIFSEMLSRSVPMYDQELAKDIVTKLYEAGLSAEANQICDMLLQKQIDFRDIYNNYDH